MLQSLRSSAGSFVVKIFFALLVIAFAFLGVGTGFRDLLMGIGSSDQAAKVGDHKITLTSLDQNFRRQIAGLQRQGPVVLGQPEKQQIARQTLDQLIVDALVANATSDAGLRVPDPLVRSEIENLPTFAGMDKKFDRARFEMALQNQGMSETAFTEIVRDDVARRLLVEPVASGAVPPKAMIDAMYRYRYEQRVGETVFLPNSTATAVPAPTDAELNDYYKKNAAAFTLPEYRSFTVLALSPDLFLNEIKLSDDDLHAAYDQHKDEFIEAEKRKIDQVVVGDQPTAEAILKATQGGKSLADATKIATAGKSQPVSLDFTTEDQFPEELRAPVFAAAKGAVIGPVKSPLGFHVIAIADVQTGRTVTFDDAKAKLEPRAKREAATDRLAEQIDKLGDKLLGGAPMAQVAAGVGATPVTFGSYDAEGNPPPNTTADPKAAKPEPAWIAAAFKLQSGETSPFQDGANGGYFAVKLDKVVPPALQALTDVRAKVTDGLMGEKRAAATAKRAADLAKKAQSGTPLVQIAADAAGKLETTIPVTRDTSVGGDKVPPPAVIETLFKSGKVGDIATATTADGEYIVRIAEIRPADPAKAGPTIKPLMEELQRGLQEDAMSEFQLALRQRYKVTINPTAAETVAGQ